MACDIHKQLYRHSVCAAFACRPIRTFEHGCATLYDNCMSTCRMHRLRTPVTLCRARTFALCCHGHIYHFLSRYSSGCAHAYCVPRLLKDQRMPATAFFCYQTCVTLASSYMPVLYSAHLSPLTPHTPPFPMCLPQHLSFYPCKPSFHLRASSPSATSW